MASPGLKQYKRGTEYRDEIGFRMVKLKRRLRGEKSGKLIASRWKTIPVTGNVALMNNCVVWRTWRWTIGSDGNPPLHPEQSGNVNLYFNSYIVDMEIPAANSSLDKRLVPEATRA